MMNFPFINILLVVSAVVINVSASDDLEAAWKKYQVRVMYNLNIELICLVNKQSKGWIHYENPKQIRTRIAQIHL